MAENIPDAFSQLSAALSKHAACPPGPWSRRSGCAGGRRARAPCGARMRWSPPSRRSSDATEAEIVLADGSRFQARLAGRDPGTNIAVLRLEGGPQPALLAAAAPQPGALVLALGADGAGGLSVRLGAIHSVSAWHSRAGGHIDRRIGLDIRLGGGEEGGPVLDAAGGLLGISTLGPRRRVLVIPAAPSSACSTRCSARAGSHAVGSVPRCSRCWCRKPLRAEAGHSLGLMVIGVTPDGPAAQAGVLMGDILIGIDGAAARLPRHSSPSCWGQKWSAARSNCG